MPETRIGASARFNHFVGEIIHREGSIRYSNCEANEMEPRGKFCEKMAHQVPQKPRVNNSSKRKGGLVSASAEMVKELLV